MNPFIVSLLISHINTHTRTYVCTIEWVHKLETLGNHIVELALPVLLLSPWRVPRILGGIAQIGFQVS